MIITCGFSRKPCVTTSAPEGYGEIGVASIAFWLGKLSIGMRCLTVCTHSVVMIVPGGGIRSGSQADMTKNGAKCRLRAKRRLMTAAKSCSITSSARPRSGRAKIGPVLITGCSSGLGEATARIFHKAGYLTIATARNVGDLASLAILGCETLQLDVTDEDSRRATVEETERRFGPVGVLINNAGYGQYGPLEEITPELLRRVFETNVFGLLRMAQLSLPGMRTLGRGRIVNISSVAGRVTVQGGGAYHMTKYAVEALADALRPELRPFGIDVINVLPGPFVSRFRDKVVASIPETGANSPYVIYKRNIARYMLRFLQPGALGVMTAEHVAQSVFKAATTRHPRTRYNVGFLASLGPIGRALTLDRVVDALMTAKIPES
jgi:NAD(P)-dependent dehydrogenase (short-subunit alcohol dehydrogenase family)